MITARPRQGWVYFIKPIDMEGPIKIGHSWCPEDRLIDLSAWSPWPLHLIGSVKGETKDERFLHHCFADCHSHREWFHPNPLLCETIKTIIRAGTVDAIRSELRPIGSIRKPREKSPDARQRMSYRMRIYWIIRRLERASGPGLHFKMPPDVEGIMSRWNPGWRRKPQHPTDDELARLESFISNPIDVVRVEQKLRVVA